MVRSLYYATEARLTRTTDGAIGSRFSDTSYEAFAQYLTAFDRVVVVARVEDSADAAALRIEGPSISVLPVPNYRGLAQLILRFPFVFRAFATLVDDPSATYAGRVPGVVSTLLLFRARRLRADFVAFVVGDPAEVARSGAAGAVMKAAAPLISAFMRWQMAHVTRASYVTQTTLQRRYPVRRGAPQVWASNVRLSEDAFADAPRAHIVKPADGAWRLVTVGSHDATYKGHDVLLRSLSDLTRDGGAPVSLTIVGGGVHHSRYVALAQELELEHVVEFTGHISQVSRVREVLRSADLFVLASLTEGLPRALIEAMALGLPCIASSVGGVPELLGEDALVAPGDARALARAIRSLLNDPERMAAGSAENLAMAHRVAEQVPRAGLVSFVSGARPGLLGEPT